MAYASQQPSNPSTPAPWRDSFLKHVTSMKSPTFVLSTLHPVPADSAPSASLRVLPRARTCIYRGLFGELPKNKHNTAPRNPPTYESDLPTLTTDARMEKAGEVIDTAGKVCAGQTGGGGPCEAVFWVEEFQTQWRVRGTAWVLGPDVESEEGKVTRDVLQERMRATQCASVHEPWSWGTEVTAHFGNLSPGMRGTFRGPPPGQPIAVPLEKGQELGQEVESLDDEEARKNFRVMVIVPDEVDQVDWSNQKKPQRWLYTYRGKSWQAKEAGGEIIGEWEKVEVFP